MRLILGLVVAFAVAAVVGLGATWWTLAEGTAFGALRVGAWTAWPRTGTIGIDPYARAGIARTGQLPVGIGDGVAFLARTDEKRRLFDGRCDVDIQGITPAARFWTLTLYDPEGRLVPNSVNRHGFTSEEILRNTDGSFEIRVGPRARAGNWLPTGGIEHYVLMLRLYDTPVGVTTRSGRETPMPSVTTEHCP
ncbi:MAG TPA: DUF1214 domain-containing protein [Xanthobacteraceae bacterium]|nr:DUF1214 domain-containing protein [Xanthobacteraceae bacterium]